jgi:hypothetical protein
MPYIPDNSSRNTSGLRDCKLIQLKGRILMAEC